MQFATYQWKIIPHVKHYFNYFQWKHTAQKCQKMTNNWLVKELTPNLPF